MALSLSGISSISTSSLSQIKTISSNGITITDIANISSSPSAFINSGGQLLSDFGLSRQNVVALYDENSNPILESCIIYSVKVENSAQLAEHPLEDGSRMVDHKIFLPKELSVVIYLSETGYSSEYQTIKSLYEERKFITAQLKNDVYSNLQIVGLPHEESNANINRLIVQINLKEAIVVTSKVAGYTAPTASNSSTVSTTPAYKQSNTMALQATQSGKKLINNVKEKWNNLWS